MRFLQETTEWDTPNHVYVLSDDRTKMYGYVPRGTDKVIEVAKPYRFSTSGRKFQPVENTYGYTRSEEAAPPTNGTEYRVAGSANNVYTVTNDSGSWTCTCPAAKWQKGPCKHIRLIQQQ